MNEQAKATPETLGFRIEFKDNGAGQGYTIPWKVHDDGRRFRATEDEVRLWEALQDAMGRLPAKKGR